jgi:hypothetical protein
VGDICRQDSDCCGGPGVPTAPSPNGKPVHCNIPDGGTVGVCANPQSCKPNGDVCRLQKNSCNATDDCCSGNVQQNDTCHQDILGVPRCSYAGFADGGGCVPSNGACASSADCCNLTPCVPNPSYTPGGNQPEFVCNATQCVATSGGCTTNADCCPGNICYLPGGAAKGTCNPLLPPPPSDGGSEGGTANDAGSSTGGDGGLTLSDGGVCSLYGQTCSQPSDCCNTAKGVTCIGGRCLSQ